MQYIYIPMIFWRDETARITTIILYDSQTISSCLKRRENQSIDLPADAQ